MNGLLCFALLFFKQNMEVKLPRLFVVLVGAIIKLEKLQLKMSRRY